MEVLRSRYTAVDRRALEEAVEGKRRILLELFPGAEFEVEEVSSRYSEDGQTLLWTGHIVGSRRGQVVLAATGDIVSANIQTDTHTFYWIRQAEGELHVAEQVEARLGESRDDAIPVSAAEAEAASPAGTGFKAGPAERLVVDGGATQVDILVAYTQAARAAAGGATAMDNRIQLAVTEANQSMRNSGVDLEFRLVRTMEVDYDESAGIDLALSRLRGTSDGYMDELHAARSASGADMVSLWIHRVGGSGGTVGLGYLMTGVSTSFQSYAFSVAEQHWAPGPGYTFAHELGHNFGATHDVANAGGPGAYPYSYGYQNTGANPFRTIMAYNCSSVYCPKINNWSNPDGTYNGTATGTGTANNALTLRNTKATVAAFRTAAATCSYSLSAATASFSASGGSGSVQVTAGPGCSWTATSTEPWVAISTGGSGSGNGTVSYQVSANTQASSRGTTLTVAGQSHQVTQEAAAAPLVSITVQTSPSGLAVMVDGVTYVAPRTFSWAAGSSHTLTAVTQTSSGVRQQFDGWSNLGSATQTIQTPAAAATYTAQFRTLYLLSVSASPAAGGSVSQTPPPADGYYPTGASVRLQAIAQAGYQFSNWGGALSGSTNPTDIVVQGPVSVTASFGQSLATVTVQSTPSGRTLVVDGASVVTPRSFQWAAGSAHTVSVPSPQGVAGTRFAFNGWTDAGGQSRTIQAADGAVFSALFQAQYQLTLGTGIQATPPAADGFYAAGTVVRLAALSGDSQFLGWSGDLTGAANPASIVMEAPRSVAASFASAPLCTVAFETATASVPASGDLRSVQVLTQPGCAWTAQTAATWLRIVSGYGGTGPGTVRYQVAPNTQAASRSAAITAGNGVHTVTQTAAQCSFALSNIDAVVGAGPGSLTIQVQTAGGCQWTASSPNTWVGLAASATTGPGAVTVTIAPNTSAVPRVGSVVIGGQWRRFLQRGAITTQRFADVTPQHPFFEFIDLLRATGITDGCRQNGAAYCPDEVMTRSEMAKFLVRALHGENFSYGRTPYFSDVPVTHSDFAYVQKLREMGITSGCTAATFCPAQPVTRGQMAAFLVRAKLGLNGSEAFPFAPAAEFGDVPASNVFFPYIQKMKELGITAGCSPSDYCSDAPNTRGQMAVFVTRSFQ